MDSEEFKARLMSLAQDDTVPLRKIQAHITCYFKNELTIPYVKSIQTFVVRCGINKPGEVFSNVTRCSYPPNEYKNHIGIQRANYPGQQVFYCSMPTDSKFATASSTCIVETAWEHVKDWNIRRTYLTVSRWSTIRPLQLWILPFASISLNRNQDFRKIRENMTKLITDSYENPDEAVKMLMFLSDAFSSTDNKKAYYRITSAFYNSLLFFERWMSKPYDGLIYPSANTEGAGLNIVLKQHLIDTHTLYCDFVMMYSMQRNPTNPRYLNIMPASNGVIPREDGTFNFPAIF
jgi:hypothetical protein